MRDRPLYDKISYVWSAGTLICCFVQPKFYPLRPADWPLLSNINVTLKFLDNLLDPPSERKCLSDLNVLKSMISTTLFTVVRLLRSEMAVIGTSRSVFLPLLAQSQPNNPWKKMCFLEGSRFQVWLCLFVSLLTCVLISIPFLLQS